MPDVSERLAEFMGRPVEREDSVVSILGRVEFPAKFADPQLQGKRLFRARRMSQPGTGTVRESSGNE